MKLSNWTYGCEHEFGDWDRARGLPPGCGIDERDITMVNSNGIAVDPKAKVYPYGGELNTRPTNTPQGQCEVLLEFLRIHPNAAVNYRSNLHVHIRVPGLRDDLPALKRLTAFNYRWLPKVLPLIEPIPRPTEQQYPIPEVFRGALRRWRRRRRSHQTLLSKQRVINQVHSTTIQQFHDNGVPWANGRPMPFLQPRPAVNLRQLLETSTIEFRHFPGTKNTDKLLTCIEWCKDYLSCAFAELNPVELYEQDYSDREFPQFPPYMHWMEQRYRATVHDGTISKADIRLNIELFLEQDLAGKRH